ncbi:MAG: CPBP family glutamic-type intramembrane protease, partial [Novosphingobium sp.]
LSATLLPNLPRFGLDSVGQALPLLPAALLFAAMNSIYEEVVFRAAFLAPLVQVVGQGHALTITILLFGLGHLTGSVPAGIIGVLVHDIMNPFYAEILRAIESELDREQARADAAGRSYNRVKKAMALYTFQQVPFDGSGRFVLPEGLARLANVGDQLYFQGVGQFITIWNPEELYKMADDPELEGAIEICRSAAEAELAKAKKK